MVAFANVGFIGYPVTQAIFGDRAVFYTCVFNLPFNFILFFAVDTNIIKTTFDKLYIIQTKNTTSPAYYCTRDL